MVKISELGRVKFGGQKHARLITHAVVGICIVIMGLILGSIGTFADDLGYIEGSQRDTVGGKSVVELSGGGKNGIIDSTGRLIPLAREYSNIVTSPSVNDCFIVSVESDLVNKYGITIEKDGLIDLNGKELFEPIYKSLSVSRQDRVTVANFENLCAVYTYAGEIVIPFEAGYENIYTLDGTYINPVDHYGQGYDYNMFLVKKNGKYGILDNNGQVIVEAQYDAADGSYNHNVGALKVKKNDQYGYIDKMGNIFIPIQYKSIQYNTGYFIVEDNDGKMGLLSSSGKVVIPLEYDSIWLTEYRGENIKVFGDIGNMAYQYDFNTKQMALIEKEPENTVVQSEQHYPSDWAVGDIDTLKLYKPTWVGAFKEYTRKITREEFIYLAVKIYELLDEREIVIDKNIQFNDTKDYFALKGATAGITSGVGENLFGPNQEMTQEEVVILMKRVLAYHGLDTRVIDTYGFKDMGNVTVEEALVITYDILSEFGLLIKEVARTEVQSEKRDKGLVFFYERINNKDLYGYKEADTDKVVIPPQYTDVTHFNYGHAYVSLGDNGEEKFIIDEEGNRMPIEGKYDFVQPLFQYYVGFVGDPNGQENHSRALIDEDGKVVIPNNQKYIFMYAGNRVIVSSGEKSAMLDPYGNTVIPYSEDYRLLGDMDEDFCNGYDKYGDKVYLAVKDNITGLVNDDGKVLAPAKYDSIYAINEYGNVIVRIGERLGVMNIMGEEIIPLVYKNVTETYENTYIVQNEAGQYGLLDGENKGLTSIDYDFMREVSENKILVKKSGMWGYMDASSNVLVPIEYKSVSQVQPDGSIIMEKSDRRYLYQNESITEVFDYETGESYIDMFSKYGQTNGEDNEKNWEEDIIEVNDWGLYYFSKGADHQTFKDMTIILGSREDRNIAISFSNGIQPELLEFYKRIAYEYLAYELPEVDGINQALDRLFMDIEATHMKVINTADDYYALGGIKGKVINVGNLQIKYWCRNSSSPTFDIYY